MIACVEQHITQLLTGGELGQTSFKHNIILDLNTEEGVFN